MKILFAIGDLNSGGAEKVIATLANNFCKLGHSVGILMISTSSSESFYKLDERVELIPVLKENTKYSITKKIKTIREKIEIFNPSTVIAFLNYVVVYIHYALKKCKNRSDISFIVSERNNPKKVPSQLSYRLLRNHIFKKADGCVFQTHGAKAYFKNIINSEVIPNPVFIETTSSRKNISQDVLLVGSDKKEKNRSMAFKAFSIYKKSNPQSNLIVVGEKSNSKELKLLHKLSIKDSVLFVGKKNNWHEQYKNSKFFLLSSDYEGMPNALLEACALNVPCISTDCPPGGPREILENGKRGILVSTNDYKDMARQMCALSQNAKSYEYFSSINSDIVDIYNEIIISQKWLDFIKKTGKKVR